MMACICDEPDEDITRVIHPARLAVDVLLAEAARDDRSAEERDELEIDALRVAASIRWGWAATVGGAR